MVNDLSIARVVRGALGQFGLAPTYPDEQRDLQWPVAEAILQSLKQSFLNTPLQVTTSTGGRGEPRVELPVESIEPWKDTSKVVLNFSQPAQEIDPIRYSPEGRVRPLQNLRYTTRSRLEKAKTLDDVW